MGHKEALLIAARRCIEEIGYSRTTARDLVAASNTNLASIGYHYGSKEALLDKAIAQAFDEWTEQAISIALANSGTGPLERLALGWRAMLDSFADHRALLVSFVEAAAAARRRPELQKDLEHQYRTSRNRIAEQIRRELDLPDVPNPSRGDLDQVLASLAIAVSDGFALQWLSDPDRTPSGEEFLAALSTLAGLLFGDR